MTFFLTLAFNLIQFYRRVFRPVTVGVRVILIKDGKVILVRHTYMDKQTWYFPGGGIKRGETPEMAARREVWEETGLVAHSMILAGVDTTPGSSQCDHVIYYLCHDYDPPTNQKPPDSPEISERRSFPIQNLPANIYPGYRNKIDELFQPQSN